MPRAHEDPATSRGANGSPSSRAGDAAPPGPARARDGATVTVLAPRAGLAVAVIVLGLWLAALVTVLVTTPGGRPVSSDPGAPAVPYWVVLLPAAVAIAMTCWLPPRSPARPAGVGRRGRLLVTTAALVVLAVLFPVLTIVGRLSGEAYMLWKFVLFIVVPLLLVVSIRNAVRIERRGGWDRWLQPLFLVLVWLVLAKIAPWTPTYDLGGVDRLTLVVAASATAVTAGFGEELYYRRLLQTRLEAMLGAPGGIALASLAFALTHLGSHGSGTPLLDAAQVVVVQGSFGALAGVLWWRYRNVTAIVALHVLVNGWDPLVALLA